MTYRKLALSLTAVVLLLDVPLSFAAEPKAGDPVPAAIGGMESTPKSRNAIAERRKAAANIKPVDINNATVRQLKKLPGIGDAEAARIIAGRPYATKAALVTEKIIPDGIFINIKNRIEAGLPYKDPAKNKIFLESLNKPK